MSTELSILAFTAASIGFLHTLVGPDHYLPFIVMSQSGKWSLRKTALITLLCGVGHILGSVLLGILGIMLGIAATRLEVIESARGDIAAWALIAFGLVYFVWGVRRALRNRPHRHWHVHRDGTSHTHAHVHSSEHVHPHLDSGTKSITPWVLFTIFVLGPCEPLIPLLIYPAAEIGALGVVLVAAVFGSVTVLTMLGVVLLATRGISFAPAARLERYMHALAGATILSCGIAIRFLGL